MTDDLRERASAAVALVKRYGYDPGYLQHAGKLVPELLAELDRMTAERDDVRTLLAEAPAIVAEGEGLLDQALDRLRLVAESLIERDAEIERLRDLAVALEAENPALRAKLAELETELSYRRGRPPA